MDSRRYAVSTVIDQYLNPFVEVYCLDCNPGETDAIVIWSGMHASMFKVIEGMQRHEHSMHPKGK